jgi:SAM-dependent methyltransferase
LLDIFTYTDIVEADVRTLNPLSHEKLMLIGDLAGLQAGDTVLDLACGKGELLCQLARRHAIGGVGIDIHPPFIDAASQRARELGVDDRVHFRVADGATHGEPTRFDTVSCLGGTWIGGDFGGCLELMRRSLRPGGLLLVGEPFAEQPSLRPSGESVASLGELLVEVDAAHLELIELVVASREEWDRYAARHWSSSSAWVMANPTHELAPEVKTWTARTRSKYLADRSWLGWAVLVLRADAR